MFEKFHLPCLTNVLKVGTFLYTAELPFIEEERGVGSEPTRWRDQKTEFGVLESSFHVITQKSHKYFWSFITRNNLTMYILYIDTK